MRIIIFIVFSFLLTGCASIFQGYMNNVVIKNAPDSMKVYSSDGIEIPTTKTCDIIKIRKTPFIQIGSAAKDEPKYSVTIDSTKRIIQLRSNKDHLLIFKVGSAERWYTAYAKLSPLWFILDSFGVFPLIFDAVTGNWNYFNDIEYNEL
jgi:hypothetical protein